MWPSGAQHNRRGRLDLPARPDGRGTSNRRRIVTSIVVALIASSFATQCRIAPGNGETISVRYRAKVLGNSDMSAEIRYETPTGPKKIDVPALPWQSDWFEFDSDAAVGVIVRIPTADPVGNLQCEVQTDEPGVTARATPTRTCRASGTLPFAS
jgi:hypothetical protein